MIGAVVENVIGGFLSPRASVRRLIRGGHGIDAAVKMVLLGYLAREIFVLITPGARPDDASLSLGRHVFGLIEAYLTFGFLTVAIQYVGRLFGGAGDLTGTAITVAWYLLIISVFTPLVIPAFLEFTEAARVAAESPATPVAVPGGALLILTVSSCVMLWLLAAYIAELHGFNRTWNVLFVVIGVSIPISILASALLPAA